MGNRRHIMNREGVPYLMVLPSMAMTALFMFYPIFMTFFNSFHNYILTRPKDYGFSGLDSYVKLFEDPVFFKALKSTVVWTIWNMVLQAGFDLMMAILMSTDFRGRKPYRVAVSSPWAFGGMIVALVFSCVFTDQTRIINDVLMRAGIIKDRIPWFTIGTRAMGVLIFTTTWGGISFFIVSFLAALQSIPHDYYGATDVSGTGIICQFLYIAMPLIRNAVIPTAMLRTIWTFSIMDIIAGVATGGPSSTIITLPMYLMSKFNEGMDIGYSSCIAAVMTLILAIFAIGYSLVGGFGKGGDL